MTATALFDVSTPEGLSRVARVRESFLHDPRTDTSGIRPMIAQSWIRSATARVRPDSTEFRVEEARIDEQTLHAAEPYLRDLDSFAQDLGGYVSLTAPNGAFVRVPFLTGSEQYPQGYSMLEEVCGTNGDGTSIEEGRALWVSSKEHYREDMQSTWCFNSLIKDPFRNRIRASVGLTLPDKVALATRPEEIALVLEGVIARIARELASRASVREQALFSEYLTMARKFGSAAVLAIDGKNTVMNSAAMMLLSDSDLPVVAGYAHDVVQSRRTSTRNVHLFDGREVSLEIAPVGEGAESAGAVVVARALSSRTSDVSAVPVPDAGAAAPHETAGLFEGLAGASGGFRQVLQLAEVCVARRRPAHLVGERGTGKHEIAVRMARGWGEPVTISGKDRTATAAELVERTRRAFAEGASVVLRAADLLPASVVEQITRLWDEHGRPAAVLTMRRPTEATTALTAEWGSLEIGVSPLRLRREDIAPLATAFAERLGDKRPSARLLSVLTKADWPGNEAQLLATLAQAVEVSWGSEISVDDLPQSFHRGMKVGRLSRLEEAELYELRNALDEAAGNRSLAADLLQIGRSTLYRRLDFYHRRGFDL